MKLVEPSCRPAASHVVLVGRNRRGNWVARAQNGMFGGLFVNRAQAFKYALFENGHHPETIIEVSREIELDIASAGQIAGPRRAPEARKQFEEARTAELCYASDQEQVVDVMIALTRSSPLDSVMITGSESTELYFSLRRRGFGRAATPVTCATPKRRHVVGLVAGQNLLAALAQASAFLSTNSAIAVLIDSREGELTMKIRHKLLQMGFRIEAGVRCQRGLVLFASRRGFSQMEQAA